jgi:hypothetical protein
MATCVNGFSIMSLTILDLSDELLLHVLDLYLDPVSLARVGGACRRLSSLSRTPALWKRRIAPFAGTFEGAFAPDPKPSGRLFGALFAPRTRGWKCPACLDTLTTTSARCCPCVCRRQRFPLTVMGFSARRCRSSSLRRGFHRMLEKLMDNFEFSLELVDVLPDEESLRRVDMLLLCTTEGPELSDAEQQGLVNFVRQGGTAIVSAFSTWSSFGHYNRKLSAWLGVSVVPGAAFSHPQVTTVAGGLPTGPWDSQGRLHNMGENQFTVDTGGGMRKTYTSLYFRRGHACTGAGHVLVCSNFHWIADPHHWHGGRFQEEANRHLLLNLVADAAIHRQSSAKAHIVAEKIHVKGTI